MTVCKKVRWNRLTMAGGKNSTKNDSVKKDIEIQYEHTLKVLDKN